jgi:hypothetical protein
MTDRQHLGILERALSLLQLIEELDGFIELQSDMMEEGQLKKYVELLDHDITIGDFESVVNQLKEEVQE